MISKASGLAGGAIAQRRAFELIAGGFEKAERLAERGAVAPGPIADGRRPSAVEHVGSYRIRIGRQQRTLLLIRRTMVCGQLAVVEEARAALIQIVEEIAIDPLEIEQQSQRLADANVGEDRPACVEDEIGRKFRQTAAERLLDDAAIAGGGKAVAGLPAGRIGFRPYVIKPGLERFEIGVVVAIKIKSKLGEIPQAAIDRKIAAPIIGIALEGDAFSRIDGGDDIRAAANWLGQRRFFERRDVDGVFRQDRHQAEDQRQFAVAGIGKIETHDAGTENFRFGHSRVISAVIGPAVVAQQLPGEHYILGGHRRAVGKMRRRIEGEGDEASRRVGLNRARQQTVQREWLVITARHQAFDDVAAHRLNRETLDDKRIEAVKRAEHALDQPAALRRIGIDIGQRGKVVGEGGRAMHGDRRAGNPITSDLRRLAKCRQCEAEQHRR